MRGVVAFFGLVLALAGIGAIGIGIVWANESRRTLVGVGALMITAGIAILSIATNMSA